MPDGTAGRHPPSAAAAAADEAPVWQAPENAGDNRHEWALPKAPWKAWAENRPDTTPAPAAAMSAAPRRRPCRPHCKAGQIPPHPE